MEHDFTELYAQYPAIIEQMPEKFTSHEFILKMAQQNQRLYIEALYIYRGTTHRGQASPFLVVHGVLAQHLGVLTNMVEKVGDVESIDIFGNPGGSALWRKL